MTSCYYSQRLPPPGWTSLARSFERSLRGERRSERTIIESYSEVPEPSPRFLNCAAAASQRRGRDGRRWPFSSDRVKRQVAARPGLRVGPNRGIPSTRTNSGLLSEHARKRAYDPPGNGGYHPAITFPPGWAAFRCLAVDPERRGTGVGRALVEHLVALARRDQATHLVLHSIPLMTIAVGLYQRMGFARLPSHDFRPRAESSHQWLAYGLALGG